MEMFNAHWDKLRIFYQIATIGSFSGAAEILNTSQSALSRSIAILEEYLRIQLFERTPRGLVLTHLGEILFGSLKKINSELIQAQSSLEEAEKEPVGFIRIAGTTGFASMFLSTIIPDFLSLYPNIQISIYGSDTLPNLHSAEVDAVIYPFIDSDESLMQTYLTTFHLKLYASKDYLQKFGVPETASDLDHHRLLAYGDHKTFHPFINANWHLTAGTKQGCVRHPYVMINSAIGLYNLALAGTGIICLSKEHSFLNNPSLVEILPSVKGPSVDAYFIHSSRIKKIKRINLLKEFLVEQFKNSLNSTRKSA